MCVKLCVDTALRSFSLKCKPRRIQTVHCVARNSQLCISDIRIEAHLKELILGGGHAAPAPESTSTVPKEPLRRMAASIQALKLRT